MSICLATMLFTILEDLFMYIYVPISLTYYQSLFNLLKSYLVLVLQTERKTKILNNNTLK